MGFLIEHLTAFAYEDLLGIGDAERVCGPAAGEFQGPDLTREGIEMPIDRLQREFLDMIGQKLMLPDVLPVLDPQYRWANLHYSSN